VKPAVQIRRAQRFAARSLAGGARALLVALALGGCAADGDSPRPATDGGARFDAAAVDAAIVFLDAAIDAPATQDASAIDAGPMCSAIPCDPRLERPCGPDATNGCRLDADGPVCVGIVGTASADSGCETADDCAAGLVCFASAAGGGSCGTPCCPGDDTACGVSARCASTPTLIDGTVTRWGRCVPTRACDVLGPASCDSGDGCYIVSSRGDTDCRAAGTVEVGGTCDGESACLPGLFCAGLMARTCVRICALGDGGPGVCPSDEGSCRAYPYSPAGTGICS